jgi:hypothetical protein
VAHDLNRLTDVSETEDTTVLFTQHYELNADGTRASSTEAQMQLNNLTHI